MKLPAVKSTAPSPAGRPHLFTLSTSSPTALILHSAQRPQECQKSWENYENNVDLTDSLIVLGTPRDL